jgi:hypothetical protein
MYSKGLIGSEDARTSERPHKKHSWIPSALHKRAYREEAEYERLVQYLVDRSERDDNIRIAKPEVSHEELVKYLVGRSERDDNIRISKPELPYAELVKYLVDRSELDDNIRISKI